MKKDRKNKGSELEKSGEEKREEEVKEKERSFDVEAKIKKIEESKMPDEQKETLVRDLKISESEGAAISFAVYCQRRNVAPHVRVPMQSYPKAKGMKMASLEAWDEVYKNF